MLVCVSPPWGGTETSGATDTQGLVCGAGDGSHGGADPLQRGGTTQAAAPASGLNSICF